MKHISIIICVDVDPDGSNAPKDGDKATLNWCGFENEIPKIMNLLNDIKDSEGNSAKFSWFLRCDEQMYKTYGNYCWLYDNFNEFISKLMEEGHEIGWHPHLTRRKEGDTGWSQEITDREWMNQCLENSFNGFIKRSKTLPSVRMGWAYHNNETMNKLNDMGVQADLSAIPNLNSEGRSLSGSFCDYYDWKDTPERPYHPSKNDYRIEGEDKLKILEIPMTVSRDPLIYALYGMAVDNKFRMPPSLHPLTPLKVPNKFQAIMRRQVKIIKRKFTRNYIGMYFHPTDLFMKDAVKILRANLNSIPQIMEKEKVTFSFHTAREVTSRSIYKS